jgi:hypothetical protein
MKRYINYLALLALVVFTTGCFEDPGTDELITENTSGFVEISEATTGETQQVYAVRLDGEFTPGSVTLSFGGAVSNRDVSVTYEIVGESTNAVAGVDYNLLSGNTVTIPAGEYTTTINYEVNDDILDPTAAPKTLTFRITDSSEPILEDGQEVTIGIVGTCPLDAPFTGDFLIEDITGSGPGGGAPVLGDGIVVTVESTGDVSRIIRNVTYLPTLGIGQPAIDFPFELFCSRSTTIGEYETNLACSGNAILFGPASPGAQFDPTDDSQFEVTFIEDTNGICGGPEEVTIRFTKQ